MLTLKTNSGAASGRKRVSRGGPPWRQSGGTGKIGLLRGHRHLTTFFGGGGQNCSPPRAQIARPRSMPLKMKAKYYKIATWFAEIIMNF